MHKAKSQKEIAQLAEISDAFLSQILAGLRRPSWKTAKKLSKITFTTPELWLDGSPDQIKSAITEPYHD